MAALSYEMAASILLCAEDSSSILGFGGEEDDALVAGERTSRAGPPPPCVDVDFAVPSEECVARLVETEADHMPGEDYAERLRGGVLDLRVRVHAIDWIWKVHSYYNFAPLTACLAVNYLDRFLSLYQLQDGKDWMAQLLSVACLSLAAKMEETDVPQSLDLQVGEARHVFEAKTIQRMELLVLSTLKWRMQAVTPFSYVDYFLHQLTGGNAPSRRSALRSAELILSLARGTECLDFRPSEIAAAVAATVVGEEEHDVAIPTVCLNKARVSRCREVIQAMDLMVQPLQRKPASPSGNNSTARSEPQSPTGVLDAAGCLSCRSDDSSAAAASSPEADSSRPVSSKRRKICR